MKIPFWLFLNKLLVLIWLEEWLCWLWNSGDMLIKAMELFMNWLFNVIAIILIIKIIMNIFFKFSSSKSPTLPHSTPQITKSIRADWSWSPKINQKIKITEEDNEIVWYFDLVKMNAKKQLLPIIFLIIYVFAGVLTKSISC